MRHNTGFDPLTSLKDRIRAMHALWQSAASDVSAEQVNHRPQKGVLPLACSFTHCIICEDAMVSWYLLGRESLWSRGQFQDTVKLAVPVSADPSWNAHESLPPLVEGSAWVGVPVESMQEQQIGSWDAWKTYQTGVVRQTEAALEQVTLEQLLIALAPRLPRGWTQGFIARLVKDWDDPLRLLDLLEAGVYAHGLRHIGEVEYGRSFVGLSGLSM